MKETSHINDKLSIDELLHRSWKHKGSSEFFKFFNFISSFHHYSRFNTMLVYLQNDAVTIFGGTSFWKKKFDRSIKENARPYVILAPMGPVMMVYDIMDTEGSETPQEFLIKGLGRKPFEVKGTLDPKILDNVMLVAKSYGIEVITKEQSYFKGGHITTILSGRLEILLNLNTTIEERFSIIIHELAHLFLGHTGHRELLQNNSKKKITLLQRRLTKTARELEAETVSFLICKKMGLETRSAEYISSYIKNEDDLLTFSYESVIKMTDKIEALFIKNRGFSNYQTTMF